MIFIILGVHNNIVEVKYQSTNIKIWRQCSRTRFLYRIKFNHHGKWGL